MPKPNVNLYKWGRIKPKVTKTTVVYGPMSTRMANRIVRMLTQFEDRRLKRAFASAYEIFKAGFQPAGTKGKR